MDTYKLHVKYFHDAYGIPKPITFAELELAETKYFLQGTEKDYGAIESYKLVHILHAVSKKYDFFLSQLLLWDRVYTVVQLLHEIIPR